MIIGVGTDLVCIDRIARVLARHPDRFVGRILSQAERARFDAFEVGPSRTAYVAKQFAAKEAVSKALGTGMREGVQFNRIEVLRNSAGQPSVKLLREALMKAASLGVQRWHLSLSDEAGFVVSVAIAEGLAPIT
jgi:holo-[acyl-carrier protein] synthase